MVILIARQGKRITSLGGKYRVFDGVTGRNPAQKISNIRSRIYPGDGNGGKPDRSPARAYSTKPARADLSAIAPEEHTQLTKKECRGILTMNRQNQN